VSISISPYPVRSSASRWYCIDLPPTEYRRAWQLQKELVAARRVGSLDRDTVLMLEHPPVFTLGRRGGMENLTVSESFLEQSGIALVQVERGGSVTFHGPGQLVVYPILDLQATGLGVADYVSRLEEIMLRTAADWGIAARRRSLNRGIWVGSKKMGSIGIAVRRGTAFHGLALNVDLPLDPESFFPPPSLDIEIQGCGSNPGMVQCDG